MPRYLQIAPLVVYHSGGMTEKSDYTQVIDLLRAESEAIAKAASRLRAEDIDRVVAILKDCKGKIVLLEDYDINLARHLVQGVDVWLNNPRRPLEASGTSGQKVVLNGGLNCSILDGWWAEAFDGQNGFAIGTGRSHVNTDIQDDRDARALTKVLTDEVIPLFYDRDEDDGLATLVTWTRARH